MKRFIAFFDYLGFKEFIVSNQNDLKFQQRIIRNNLRDIELALGRDHQKIRTNYGVISDISNSIFHCNYFQDTIIMCTKDDSIESLEEIIDVSYRFNWHSVLYTFALRGSIVYDEIVFYNHSKKNPKGGSYSIYPFFGKGLMTAYEKTESLQMAGTIIDKSIIEELITREIEPKDYLSKYTIEFPVTYKTNKKLHKVKEYCFTLQTGDLNDESINNLTQMIIRNFHNYNRKVGESARFKMENTIEFLKAHKRN